MGSKSELLAEVADLKAQLEPVLAADRARVEAEGRPFDTMGWVLGTPDSRKYPAGPAFLPMGGEPTFKNSLLSMSARDVGTTLLGSGVIYLMGLTHAGKLGVVNGHRLGLWLALPAVAIGVLTGSRNGMHRYLGFSDNGNPPLYPGYKEDATPYFVKHTVSERRVPVAPSVSVDAIEPGRRT